MLVPYLPHHLAQPSVFFFNDTATTEIYTLSLHDALPISPASLPVHPLGRGDRPFGPHRRIDPADRRSEEHTSELQSQSNLVCRLLLEKKKADSGDERSPLSGSPSR